VLRCWWPPKACDHGVTVKMRDEAAASSGHASARGRRPAGGLDRFLSSTLDRTVGIAAGCSWPASERVSWRAWLDARSSVRRRPGRVLNRRMHDGLLASRRAGAGVAVGRRIIPRRSVLRRGTRSSKCLKVVPSASELQGHGRASRSGHAARPDRRSAIRQRGRRLCSAGPCSAGGGGARGEDLARRFHTGGEYSLAAASVAARVSRAWLSVPATAEGSRSSGA